VNKDFTFRSPVPEDAKRTLDLMIRCDVAYSGEPDSEMEDLLNDWENIDLNQDAWLVFTTENKLVGCASVNPWGADLKYEIHVEPTYEYTGSQMGWVRQIGVLGSQRRTGLGSALLRTTFIEFYHRGYKKIGLAVESENLRAVSFYENVGMKQIRRFDEYSKPFDN
jgi:ribosomal protein S18 acetylase RimI-like enzyme